jgi:hypothetical protein
MRKTGREVTRKNQKTDELRIARMSRLATTEKPENCNGMDLTAGVRRGGRHTNEHSSAALPEVTPGQRNAYFLPPFAHSSSRLNPHCG